MKQQFSGKGFRQKARLSAVLGAFSSLNLVLGFGLQAFIFYRIGVGERTDALFAGMVVPQFVLTIVTLSLQYVFIPLFSVQKSDRFRRLGWSAFVGLVVLFGSASLILALAAPLWVPLLLAGFSEEAKLMTVTLTRIQLVSVVFSGVNALLWAANRSRDRFVHVEGARMFALASAFVLLALFLTPTGAVFAAWVLVLREAIQTVLLLPVLGKPVKPDFKDEIFHTARKRIVPLLVGNSYTKTDAMLDKFLISFGAVGQLSILHFAQLVMNSAAQVVMSALIVPIAPDLSRHYAEGDLARFKRRMRSRMLGVILVVLGGFGLFILVGHPLLYLLPKISHIRLESIDPLYHTLLWLFGLPIGAVVGQLLVNSFYATGDTRTPVRLGAITYTLSIPVRFGLFHLYGLTGLVAAISLHYLVSSVVLFTVARRRSYI